MNKDAFFDIEIDPKQAALLKSLRKTYQALATTEEKEKFLSMKESELFPENSKNICSRARFREFMNAIADIQTDPDVLSFKKVFFKHAHHQQKPRHHLDVTKTDVVVVFSAYSSLLGLFWGGSSMMASYIAPIIPIGFASAAIPFLGWGVMALAIVLAVGVTVMWGYLAYKNSQRKAMVETLKNSKKSANILIEKSDNEFYQWKQESKSNKTNVLQQEKDLIQEKEKLSPSSATSNSNPKKRERSQTCPYGKGLGIFDHSALNAAHAYSNTQSSKRSSKVM